MSDWSREIYDAYDEMLDDYTPMVKVGSFEYLPSRVLKELDPIAYRCGLNNYLDGLAQNGYFCLECEQLLHHEHSCQCKEGEEE